MNNISILKRIVLSFAFASACQCVWSQSQNEARKLYDAGQYEQAMPLFEKLLKGAPNNANYNMWYGACQLKSGDASQAKPYLETAVKRKATGSTLLLAETYRQLYQFEDASDLLETYIADQAKRRRPTEEASLLLEQCRKGLRMIRGVEEVAIIDSVVVDKATFLRHYKLSAESGMVLHGHDYFEDALGNQSTVFLSEIGDKMLFSRLMPDSIYSVYSSVKDGNSWGNPVLLPKEVNDNRNVSYPFVMPDGVTTYFAADGENSLGGYDIFVTRYDSEDNSYFTPENIGMPFNSAANDYMYAIDEFNNLGWFASDRNQPEDKVCIYVFIPNTTKKVYNYEGFSAEQLAQLAQIHSIKDTWTEEERVRKAQLALQQVISASGLNEPEEHDFVFVLSDDRIYHSLNDFKNPQARNAFIKYREAETAYHDLQSSLSDIRLQYAKADAAGKQRLAKNILDMEHRELELYSELQRTSNEIRLLEK